MERSRKFLYFTCVIFLLTLVVDLVVTIVARTSYIPLWCQIVVDVAKTIALIIMVIAIFFDRKDCNKNK